MGAFELATAALHSGWVAPDRRDSVIQGFEVCENGHVTATQSSYLDSTTMTPLIIIGAGGFGRECHDIVIAMNEVKPTWEFLGFVDDVEPDPDLLARRGAEWLGPVGDLGAWSGTHYVVGVGDPGLRASATLWSDPS